MTAKSTTQKLSIRWRDRSWSPRIRGVAARRRLVARRCGRHAGKVREVLISQPLAGRQCKPVAAVTWLAKRVFVMVRSGRRK